MTTSRSDTFRRERGKALLRALHLSELELAGAARAFALHQADEQLDRIARLLPDALRNGISMTDIARVTGVSRPTLYELRGRYDRSIGDLRFSLLQAVATRQPVSVDELRTELGKSGELDEVLAEFEKQGLIEYDVAPIGEQDEGLPVLLMAPYGYQTLEEWNFEDMVRADEPEGES